ncbi:PrgI family protein [Butyrivibrio sp. INlla16]|uniref:PrgI family protein n=1 Tax=Butyrivibrio sp. INlla16 TaxID=1520807 RepID=UPI000A86E433|nr:PrgI family protein [Butyrivibrio sp. INlla16]
MNNTHFSIPVPKDLRAVKTTVFANLTLRQLICIGIGAGFGIPTYFLSRDYIGYDNAALAMVAVMLPMFFFGVYEKNGCTLEEIWRRKLRHRYWTPKIRKMARATEPVIQNTKEQKLERYKAEERRSRKEERPEHSKEDEAVFRRAVKAVHHENEQDTKDSAGHSSVQEDVRRRYLSGYQELLHKNSQVRGYQL